MARIADPKGLSHVFGAFLGDALVGTVTLEFSAKPKIRHKAHLIGMFVSPAARGCGAGRALVQAAIGMASERPGLRVMTLTVTEGNAAAIGLYESCGFKVFGVEPLAIAAQQGFKSKLHMWREALPASAASSVEG
ncbi:GNAT family N-acetyltransferase [Comamonas antarctica]|uniref:GNAT family N-acetyltransferase n=1 Tax=Comamonas antarctica TaxID=2743470 RepID=UPI0028E6E689|nr:GNAT family N-acetyltransferase [Comamonas antarctica]